MSFLRRGIILLLCLSFFASSADIVKEAHAANDIYTINDVMSDYSEYENFDSEELEALEKNEETTDVTLVLDNLDSFFDKLESNKKKKKTAIKKHAKELKEQKKKEKIEKIIAFAMKQRGKRYVWGATGPNTFDCSGLMLYVFKHFGYSLPRVSASQAQIGKHLSRSEIKRGDMVFFKDKSGKICHVGLYLGNGQFIHAPHTGDVVKVSALSGRRFAWGIRIIKS